MRCSVAVVVAMTTLLGVISGNLEYVTRMADAAGITEGKFDRVRGDDNLVVTGRFGFKTYDVSDPEEPELLDTFLPDGIAEFGYWQDEDMELDTRRNLIIGALDPATTTPIRPPPAVRTSTARPCATWTAAAAST